MMRNAFNKIIDLVRVWGGRGPTITVAWGLTRPKSGPVCVSVAVCVCMCVCVCVCVWGGGVSLCLHLCICMCISKNIK